MIIKSIEGVHEETLEKMRALSASSLPVNPSERGMTPEQIKARFYAPILASSYSAIAELERVIAELNGELALLDTLLSGESVTVGEDQKTLDELIQLSAKNGQSLKEYSAFLESEISRVKERADAAFGVKGEVALLQQSAAQQAKNAEAAKNAAEAAKGAAEAAKLGAQEARDKILNLKVVCATLPHSDEPYVEKTDIGGTTQLIFHLPTGKPFRVARLFTSVKEMNEGFASDSVAEGEFVVIDTGNVEDVENARLYIKGGDAYVFVTDLSGATGIRGTDGYTPVRGVDYMTPEDLENLDAYIDGRLGEEDTLPENLGSRTLKVLIATPKNKDGSFDEQFRYPSDYGEASNDPDKIALRGEPFDKEYFAKPLVGGEGDGDIGIIMHSNRDKKLEEGLISDAEYDRYADHDEPYLFYEHAPEKYRYTIATRDTNGQLTVEPGTKPFHVPTMQQLRDSLYHDRLTDLFELDADGFGKNVFASTSDLDRPSTLYKDFDATDSPVYPMPIAHWYPDKTVNGSLYYMRYDIPSSLQKAEFDISFWLYDNDFHYPIENVYDDYHSFRIKLASSTYDASAHSDSGNIVYLEPRQTFKIGDRAHATVDANIGKWHHITIHCKAGTDSCKYLFVGTNIMNPPESITEGDYDYSTGLHMSMPVMVEGALKWYVRYRNAHYGVLKTGTPVVDGDAANKGYVDARVGDVEEDLNACLSARAGVLDVFELDDDGFAKSYTPSVSDSGGNLIFTVTKESSDKNCPFYPRPMARFTAHQSFTGENRVSVFSIGSYPGNPWFSVGFWLYDNLSEKNQFRLALGFDNTYYAVATFPARSSLSVGDIVTSSVFDFQYIVDAKVGNWYHIKLPCIAPDRFFCVSIGSFTSSAGEYLKFSMPVVVEEQDMHWAVEYPNKYVSLPIKAGAPIEENDAANKAYVDGLVGDVEEALEGIINIQNSLIGGETV